MLWDIWILLRRWKSLLNALLDNLLLRLFWNLSSNDFHLLRNSQFNNCMFLRMHLITFLTKLYLTLLALKLCSNYRLLLTVVTFSVFVRALLFVNFHVLKYFFAFGKSNTQLNNQIFKFRDCFINLFLRPIVKRNILNQCIKENLCFCV